MAQLGNCLPHNHKDLSLVPRIHIKSHVCWFTLVVPALASQLNTAGKTQVTEDPVSKNKVDIS